VGDDGKLSEKRRAEYNPGQYFADDLRLPQPDEHVAQQLREPYQE
jgi:hypothetical protein